LRGPFCGDGMQQDLTFDTEYRDRRRPRSTPASGVELRRQLEQAHKAMWALYKELDDKNAALNRSNEELEQFATIAGHDLQEPLRKVIGFAGLLRDGHGDGLDEEGRDYLARMESACERMLLLIDDLLRLARITSQARPFERCDLGAVAGEVLADLEGQIGREGGEVEVGLLPEIEADPVQIRQLLQNLISNALKFHHPDRPPRISVSARRLDTDRMVLAVADNGIGFKTKFAERIFQPFRRLHGQGRYAGTGMGLAIVRKIAERHGGEVRVDSRLGEGSTFEVVLPCLQGPYAARMAGEARPGGR
jgi:light-regulated signal transduction histidine kinase (bacteriophytochrome)